MAIVPMQKVRLIVHETDVDTALDIVQRAGAFEFYATEVDVPTTSADIAFPNALLLPRVQHAVNFLEPYAPETGLWRTLREGSSIELNEAQIAEQVRDTDAIESIVSDLEKIQVEFAEVNEKKRLLEEQHKVLNNWKNLPIPLQSLSTNHTVTKLVESISLKEEGGLSELISQLMTENETPFLITEVSETRVAVTLLNESESLTKTVQLIEAAGATIVATPEGNETPEVEFVAVSERLAAVTGELALLHDQAEHFAITHYKNLRIVAEAITWQRDRYAVIEAAAATKSTVVFDGWLNQTKREEIESAFTEKNIAAVFTELELDEGEEPPVDLQNSPLIQPFEAVTRLYGMPGYKDLDPTVFLAGFFFLFFGMSLTDVGYGAFLMIVSLIILTLFKVAPPIRMFAKLLLFVGFSTILVGLLFGGYLGIAPEYIPQFLKDLQVYDPIGNPLPVFYTALGLGVVQVMAGMIIKIYSDYRNGKIMQGILDQGPWLFVFCMGILYLATSTGYASFISTEQIINLIYVGVAMVVLSSARKADSIFGAIQKSLLSLYDSIGYFSDILSYSRLLALGLATTALAFAVNLIASMVVETPFVGEILALAILIIGHLFTLAVNTLGAFIHSARLQFVEFFGKFISGTGKTFTPLSRAEKYIAVTDD